MNKVKFKRAAVLILISLIMLTVSAFSEEYKKFDIKYGMHESAVRDNLGDPVLTEKSGRAIAIPRKKALYKLDETNYAILYFFSGRIHKIVLLEDMDLVEASGLFKDIEGR